MPRGLLLGQFTLVLFAFFTIALNAGIPPGAAAVGHSDEPLLLGFRTIFGNGIAARGLALVGCAGLAASFHAIIYAVWPPDLFVVSRRLLSHLALSHPHHPSNAWPRSDGGLHHRLSRGSRNFSIWSKQPRRSYPSEHGRLRSSHRLPPPDDLLHSAPNRIPKHSEALQKQARCSRCLACGYHFRCNACNARAQPRLPARNNRRINLVSSRRLVFCSSRA